MARNFGTVKKTRLINVGETRCTKKYAPKTLVKI